MEDNIEVFFESTVDGGIWSECNKTTTDLILF